MTRFSSRLAVTAVLSLTACATSFAHAGLRAPAHVRVSAGAHVVVSWSAVPGARRYQVGLATGGGSDHRPVRGVLQLVGPAHAELVRRSGSRRADAALPRPGMCAGRLLGLVESLRARPAEASPSPPTPGPGPGPGPGPNTTPGAPLSFAASPQIGGCPVFPSDNAFNQDVSSGPVDPGRTPT